MDKTLTERAYDARMTHHNFLAKMLREAHSLWVEWKCEYCTRSSCELTGVMFPRMWLCHDCFKNDMNTTPVCFTQKTTKLEIGQFETCPEGWDLIMYYGKQAFLRHDGIIVHLVDGSGWCIWTPHKLYEVNIGFDHYYEAVEAVEEYL